VSPVDLPNDFRTEPARIARPDRREPANVNLSTFPRRLHFHTYKSIQIMMMLR
jgi:hypothetical protein